MQQNGAMNIVSCLREPDSSFRPIPFWSWNDSLQPDELHRQIKLMSASGAGGYFMHARSGLRTEYLSDEWFHCVSIGIEEGQKSNMSPWVYDEEGWPSGFAGGKVSALGDWVYARGLHIRRFHNAEEIQISEGSLGVYACCADDSDATLISDALYSTAHDHFVEIYQTYSPHYIDVLNEKVVHAFIDITHESYAKRFPLGDTGLTGFFTDEPRLAEGPIPWSYILPDAFMARFGYDLTGVLPALFLPCKNYRKTRHDFWSLVNDLFVNSYMKQLGAWCSAHQCRLTGHVMMEESLFSQMTGTGGSMPFYEYMQMPGIDSLRRNVNDNRVPKQVGSAAEQLGIRHVITESYAMSGWDLGFAEMRWIAAWQYSCGVNVMCQHLQAYSLQGMRKRDYPPSLFYQQTWYDEYERFNTYLARMGQLLSDGPKAIEVLLLHPMHSGWISYDSTNNEEISRLDHDFEYAAKLLSEAHIDYHLGDEILLRRHASITPEGYICVGQYTYQIIALPSMLTLDSNTVSLLDKFVHAGHTLLQIGSWPEMCEGQSSDIVKNLQRHALMVRSNADLHTILDSRLRKPIWIREDGTDASAIQCCQTCLEDGTTVVLLVNLERDRAHQINIILPGNVKIQAINLDSLYVEPLTMIKQGNRTECALNFLPMQVHTLICENSDVQTACSVNVMKSAHIIRLGNSPLHIDEIEDNVLTLDACEYKIDNGMWMPPKAVIHLMDELINLRSTCQLAQRFTFTVRCSPHLLKRLRFVMEQPELYTVLINGHIVSFSNDIWYKDISFKTTDILPYVVQGNNLIEVHTTFFQSPHVYEVLFGKDIYETELNKLTYDMELENVYLIGDFGVFSQSEFVEGERNSIITNGPFVLDQQNQYLQPGCFTEQGLLFFAGIVSVEHSFNLPPHDSKVFLDLGKVRAALVKVSINGNPEHTLLWDPYLYDISELVCQGDNHLKIKLFASNRNMFGPHHHTSQENYSVGPLSYTGKFSWADRQSESIPITPEMRKQTFWQSEYSFVTFGLSM